MNNAELYHKNNTLQKRDALNCLEDYSRNIKWKSSGGRILDIGCGDGSVTTTILRNYIPSNFQQIVGCDRNETMIKFANEHYGNEETTFFVLDIEGDLPENYKNSFNHAFSFYVLHWCLDQKTTFSNIYNMLTEGGSILVLFLGYNPIYNVYRVLSTQNKWSYWLKDVKNYISPYHDKMSEKEIEAMLDDIGFTGIDVQFENKSYRYDNIESIKRAVMAINPFYIPPEMNDDFYEDYISVLRDMKLLEEENNVFAIEIVYNTIVINATK